MGAVCTAFYPLASGSVSKVGPHPRHSQQPMLMTPYGWCEVVTVLPWHLEVCPESPLSFPL